MNVTSVYGDAFRSEVRASLEREHDAMIASGRHAAVANANNPGR
jgi:hypothetical protein